MRRNVLALSLAWFTFVLAVAAGAQGTKTARGTVTSVGAGAIGVKSGAQEMKFAVDAKTVLIARGAGTAARQAQASGGRGANLADFVKVGDAVEVEYHEAGMHAASIRRVTDPGSGSGDPATKTELSEGTVEAISAASVTISGSSGGGASFKQTFTIDSETRVVGRGVGTAAAARGGKPVITDLIKTGDHVTVSYSKTDKTLHAREIRVRPTPK